MRNQSIVFILLGLTFIVRGQNLVPNGNFETYSMCPTDHSQILLATGWRAPTAGTPDYFNSCSFPTTPYAMPVGVPSNFFGTQFAHSGNGYAGFAAQKNVKEYVQNTLSTTLIKDKHYYFEMYLSLAEFSCRGTRIGVFFSSTAVHSTEPFIAVNLNYTPQVLSPDFITDKSGWTKVSGCYTAQGGERYITIGNFQPSEQYSSVSTNLCPPTDSSRNYYYVDDVSLIPDYIEPKDLMGNDTNLCGVISPPITLKSSVMSAANYLWNTGSTDKSIQVQQPGTYWLLVSDSLNCPLYTDTIKITTSPNPSVDLGPDTNICNIVPVLFDAKNQGAKYLWNNGSTTRTIVASQKGSYSVKVTDTLGCFASDTVNLIFQTPPVVNLGHDTVVCKTSSLTLDAQNPGANYLWNTGSTNQSIYANQSGAYFVKVTKNYCSAIDTINLSFQPPPNVNLGNDTIVCEGSIITLDAYSPGATYKWQNGSTSPKLQVTSSGKYSVKVSVGVCVITDSIMVYHQLKPFLNLGPDSSYCFNHPVVLDASNSMADSYLWIDGSTSKTFTASTSGLYWVKIKKDVCYVYDTVDLIQKPLPSVNIGPDQILCKENMITLDAGNSGSVFIWNDQSTSQTLSARPPGLFYVKVTNPEGCFSIDTIALDTFISPVVSIGNDTFVCEGGSTLIDAGTKFSSYQWQDGSTRNSFLAKKAGTYFVTITDQNQCSASDTIQLSFKQKPIIDINNIIPVCEPDFNIRPANNFMSYLWQDGSTASSYHVTDYGTYTLKVTDTNYCSNNTNIEVISNCSGTVFVPNAFTPNTDGNNDLFYPVTRNLKSISWKLYNRWGELVFETNEFKKGWDGTFKGENAQGDVYTYVIFYQSLDGRNHTKSGNVTLLR